MAMKREMEVTISPSGEVSMTVKCVPGKACEEFSQFLEDALGGEVLDRTRTAEYYEEVEEATNKITTSS